MDTPVNPTPEDEEEGEVEEISVEITDDNLVWVYGSDWELVLSPDEARDLAQALVDAAADAENPEGEGAA